MDVGDIFWILALDSYIKIVDVSNQNGVNRHQHLLVVTHIFRLQHPSPTSIWTIRTRLWASTYASWMMSKISKDGLKFWLKVKAETRMKNSTILRKQTWWQTEIGGNCDMNAKTVKLLSWKAQITISLIPLQTVRHWQVQIKYGFFIHRDNFSFLSLKNVSIGCLFVIWH